MHGRLRVVIIDAEGETAAAAIDAAMQAFGRADHVAALPQPAAVAAALPAPDAPAERKPRAPARRTANRPKAKPAARAPKAAKRAPAAAASPAPPRAADAEVNSDGVSVDTTPDAESISYGGRTTELTAEQAELAALLARAMPTPVAREFLIKKLGLTSAFAEQTLSTRASRLREAVATIGLEVKTVRGVGIALVAESA